MDWDKLKIFHNVALDLNISEAANKMNISHSSISRQISSLERDLKVSLFKRHARGLTLTEQGKILFKTAHDIFGKIALTESQLTSSKEKTHRLTTHSCYCCLWYHMACPKNSKVFKLIS